MGVLDRVKITKYDQIASKSESEVTHRHLTSHTNRAKVAERDHAYSKLGLEVIPWHLILLMKLNVIIQLQKTN